MNDPYHDTSVSQGSVSEEVAVCVVIANNYVEV
jgi:hypothetical protein